MKKVNFILSDVYEALALKKYDLILFNPPLLHCEPIAIHNGFSKRFDDIAIDHKAVFLKRFAKDAKKYLKQDGRIVALVSNIGSYGDISEFTDSLEEVVSRMFCMRNLGTLEASGALFYQQ